MLWVKAFHIVFVASWFAGLFYLPRLYVNVALAEEPVVRARLLLMARKLLRFATMLAVPAVLLGAWLFLGYGVGLHGPGNGWMHAKLALVVLAIGYHHACAVMLRKLERGIVRSDRFYRVFNEAAVVLFAAIVVLVVVKPF
jgi:protoporphyrinogen IX oxidase